MAGPRHFTFLKSAFAFGMLMMTINASASTESGAGAIREPAGHLPDGQAVEVITLSNGRGMSARILTFGAILQSLTSPDRTGNPADILLGYDDLQDYVDDSGYFGATIGRYANRIAGGEFTLDGRRYQVPPNNDGNALHGGAAGFGKKLWQVAAMGEGAAASVTLTLTSPDGDSGFPGTLAARVTYRLDDEGALTIDFEASSDKPTIVNMTNHAYFNLAGEGAPEGAMGHLLTIPASSYTPVDSGLIPTGELRRVEGSVFDFRTPRRIGDGVRDGRDAQIGFGRGYDHNFVLDKGLTAQPGLAARLEDPGSGRVLEVWTTDPGLQFYSGNFLDGKVAGKHGHLYRMGEGIALEPQKFPDSPNRPGFPTARVDPGKRYRHVMIYKLSVKR